LGTIKYKILRETESPRLRASLLFDKKDPQTVLDEVKTTVSMMFLEFDFETLDGVFEDVVRLFKGKYPGYRKCNTQYNDLEHTIDTLLAMVRLVHGAMINGEHISEKNVGLGLISALFHDTGYIQRKEDNVGTGAKFTASHIKRSTEFMKKYFLQKGYSLEDFEFCAKILKCTGLNVNMNESQFIDDQNNILGKILGAADLLSQISNRNYLEKLPFLFHQFKEANIRDYESELDLLEKTPAFLRMTMKRFETELNGVYRYMKDHFWIRWGIDENLYMTGLEETLRYVEFILENHRDDYHAHLRRGGLIKRLKEMLK
jgi:hypothetical protein